ncbi:MFS transporter [Patulibacter minatonensis]|uniref:MFS transporter n=1 Tax=Patulibacter minatonensis TaxID=298163 RepID=UPI0004BA9F6F|nr:MFS transporter [Patulibacter minatonensis]
MSSSSTAVPASRAPGDPTPSDLGARRRRHHGLAFWSVAFAFLVVMAFSTAPSPLYGLYQERDGFSSFVVTLVYAGYAVGVVGALVFAGHLSDWHGRRRVMLPAIAVSVLSAIVFLLWRDVPGLVVARILNGISVGVVAATATAYLAELHAVSRPDAGPRHSQLVATAVNLGGLALGPIVSGVLAQWTDRPLSLPYLVFLVVLVAAIAVVALAPETRDRLDPLPSYRPQRISVPAESRSAFSAAALGAFLAFGVLGLFTGLASVFLVGTLHHPSHALAGLTLALMFGGGVVAQTLTSSWALPRVLAAGTASMLLGLTLVVVAVWLDTPSLALFLAGGAFSGAGAGAVFKGTVGTVAAIAPPETRAEALAGLFLAGYLGLSVPVVGAGVALQYASPRATLTGFALLVGGAILLAAPRLVRGPRVPTPTGRPAGSPA